MIWALGGWVSRVTLIAIVITLLNTGLPHVWERMITVQLRAGLLNWRLIEGFTSEFWALIRGGEVPVRFQLY